MSSPDQFITQRMYLKGRTNAIASQLEGFGLRQ